jgi:hypothetical protein
VFVDLQVVSSVMRYRCLYANGLDTGTRPPEAATPAAATPEAPLHATLESLLDKAKVVAGRYFQTFDWVDNALVPAPARGGGEAVGEEVVTFAHACDLLGDVGLLGEDSGAMSKREVEGLIASAAQESTEGRDEHGEAASSGNGSRRRRQDAAFRRWLLLLCEHLNLPSEPVIEVAERAAVLIQLLERVQSHARLRLDKILKVRMAKNFISKDFRQAKCVHSIFSAFLHHCALSCPSLQELEAGGEVDLHVLECFQATISTIADTLLDPRSQARAVDIIATHGKKAEFLMTMRPAIMTESVRATREAPEGPLLLHAQADASRRAVGMGGALTKADVSSC